MCACVYIYTYRVYVYVYIQGVSRLVDITAVGDFLGLCDRKFHINLCPILDGLRNYGQFLIPVHTIVWTASYGTSWRVMYSTWWLIVCGSCNEQLAQFTTDRQPVLRPAVAFSKTSFKHRSIQIKGNFPKLTLRLYFKYIMYFFSFFFLLALQPPSGVVFYSPLAGFSLLACEDS